MAILYRFSFRTWCALGVAACVGGMGFALFVQHVLGFEPCPLCVFQRVAMIAAGVAFLAGALHGPSGGVRWVYASLATLASLAGVGLALRHLWLQSLPPDQVPACGPTLDYLMEILPLREVIETILRGDGSCAVKDVQWFGITLPGYTLMAFTALTLWSLAAGLFARKDPA